MALSVFDDKSKAPTARALKNVLGRTSGHWDNLIAHVASEYAPLDKAWNFAGAAWGWSLCLKQKKRTVLYMTPCEKYFYVGLVLGERAVKLARKAGLPETALSLINQAKRYAEGRAIRLEVRNKADLATAKALAEVKMAN